MKRCGSRALYAAVCLVGILSGTGCGGRDGLAEFGRYAAGDVEAVLLAGRTDIDTAERLELRLRVSAPDRYEILLPGVEQDFGEFELFDFQSYEAVAEADGTLTWEERYVLEPFLPGDYQLPPLVVRFREGANGRLESVQTGPVPVSVTSVLGAEADAAELQDIAPVAGWPGRRWVWIAPALALCACALLALGMFARRRRKRPQVKPERRIAPHLVAWQELEALLAEGLLERCEWDPFYTRLTGILRRYIDARFGIRAPKLTSRELIGRVRSEQTLEDHDQALLRQFLDLGDLVKFARREPEPAVANASVEQCKAILTDTAPGGGKLGGRH